MSNWYFESPHTNNKPSNRLTWAIAACAGFAAVVWGATHPAQPKPKMAEVYADTPVVRQACSSGYARSYTDVETTMNGGPVVVRCDKYWATQGQRMPGQKLSMGGN